MNIIFFGSDDFAALHLESLIQQKQCVKAVVTQPDRPKGRGMKMILSPTKQLALTHDITCLQPDDIKEGSFLEQLKSMNADLFIVIAYGKILPSEVLSIPKIFAINVHPSLLPKYRGAAPINWAVINGDRETGVSIIRLNPRMDAGDILAQSKMAISTEDTSITLRERLIQSGKELLQTVLENIGRDQLQPVVQKENEVTKAPKLSKELGHINWSDDASTIHNLARGLLPWPGACTFYNEKMLKIFHTSVVNKGKMPEKPGTLLEIGKEGIVIACGRDALRVGEVHLADSKRITAHSFATGYQLITGFQFGSV